MYNYILWVTRFPQIAMKMLNLLNNCFFPPLSIKMKHVAVSKISSCYHVSKKRFMHKKKQVKNITTHQVKWWPDSSDDRTGDTDGLIYAKTQKGDTDVCRCSQATLCWLLSFERGSRTGKVSGDRGTCHLKTNSLHSSLKGCMSMGLFGSHFG